MQGAEGRGATILVVAIHPGPLSHHLPQGACAKQNALTWHALACMLGGADSWSISLAWNIGREPSAECEKINK